MKVASHASGGAAMIRVFRILPVPLMLLVCPTPYAQDAPVSLDRLVPIERQRALGLDKLTSEQRASVARLLQEVYQLGVQSGRDQAESSSAPRISGSANVLSANALYREFQNNPIDGSKRYVGKAVALEGLRGEVILKSDGVQAVVHIVDGSRSNALILVFSDRNQLTGINQGQRFRFKCMVRKYEYSIVWMDDCSIDR
jgi:hypothetical protein